MEEAAPQGPNTCNEGQHVELPAVNASAKAMGAFTGERWILRMLKSEPDWLPDKYLLQLV